MTSLANTCSTHKQIICILIHIYLKGVIWSLELKVECGRHIAWSFFFSRRVKAEDCESIGY